MELPLDAGLKIKAGRGSVAHIVRRISNYGYSIYADPFCGNWLAAGWGIVGHDFKPVCKMCEKIVTAKKEKLA